MKKEIRDGRTLRECITILIEEFGFREFQKEVLPIICSELQPGSSYSVRNSRERELNTVENNSKRVLYAHFINEED